MKVLMLTDDRSRYYRLRGREAWALPEPVAWTLILLHSESEESRILGIARSRISQATPAAMYCDNKMLVSEARAQLAQMHPTTAPFEVQLRGSFLHRSVASVAHHTPHTTHHTPWQSAAVRSLAHALFIQEAPAPPSPRNMELFSSQCPRAQSSPHFVFSSEHLHQLKGLG